MNPKAGSTQCGGCSETIPSFLENCPSCGWKNSEVAINGRTKDAIFAHYAWIRILRYIFLVSGVVTGAFGLSRLSYGFEGGVVVVFCGIAMAAFSEVLITLVRIELFLESIDGKLKDK